jgi:PAS domain S-box-containing protein
LPGFNVRISEAPIDQKKDILDKFTQKKTVSGSLRILIPLYAAYAIFVLSIFLIFIPQQKKQLMDQKKDTILQLTDSVLSLLSELDSSIHKGKISPEQARSQAIHQIRNLRFGPEGKDYFWINDMHPFMVMHPYRPDLEGRDVTLFKDPAGNFPFVAMVETVMANKSGYVNYYWQWKDSPQKIVPKMSYVKGFAPWGWIIGTGMYMEDIDQEIKTIRQNFLQLFGGILVFIVLISLYITKQVVKIEHKKNLAEQARDLEELRLIKLFELSQMTRNSTKALTEFALEEAIHLTQSQIGYLAFLNEDASQLTMHTWSKQTMKECEIEDKILIYNVADTGLWAEAARSGKPIIINDYPNFSSPGKKGYPEGHVKILRVMNVPIFDGDKMVALTGVGNKGNDYNDSDVRQLELMMDGMWKILQRKKTEDDLHKREEQYRLLAENATDGIWVIQLSDFIFSYVSPAMEYLSGYTPAEYIGSKMGAHLTLESREEIAAVISEELDRAAKVGATGKRFRVLELEMIQKSGAIRWVEVNARFLTDDKGIPDRILGVTRDITHRKKLEEKLIHSNAELRLAQKIAGVGNWSIDLETDLRVWSKELYQIYERDPELGPYSFAELQKIYVGEWWEKYTAAVQKADKDGLPFDIELKIILPSGKMKWVNAVCEPEAKPGAKGHYLRGTVQDITDRKKMEARIQQTQKMEALGTLAGGIAHDFNNILSAIFGFAELAKLTSNGDEETVKNLNQVLAAGLRAKELVKHILTFSRKSDAQKNLVGIASLAKECVKFLKASVSPNIEIHTHFFRADSMVLADPTQLHQVFMNLFTNAAHAMKEKGGVLDVRLESIDISADGIFQLKNMRPGRYVRLTVSDTGSGIPKNVVGKIFDPFFTTKVKGEGTGMGLALVYGIIKEMQGSVTVYSEQGMGSTFEILIPEQPHGTGIDENNGIQLLKPGKGRILIVDDEPSIIEWTSQMLMAIGYDIVGTNNGRDAAETFKQDPMGFDLVLTDLVMPGMTGLELSKLIKSQRPDIPIILCTGFSSGIAAERLAACGISGMVMKPIIASELSRIINASLNKKV